MTTQPLLLAAALSTVALSLPGGAWPEMWPPTVMVNGLEVRSEDAGFLLEPIARLGRGGPAADHFQFLGEDQGAAVGLVGPGETACRSHALVFAARDAGPALTVRAPTGAPGLPISCNGMVWATTHGAISAVVHPGAWFAQFCLAAPGWLAGGECHISDFQAAGLAGPCLAEFHIFLWTHWVSEIFAFTNCAVVQAGAQVTYATIS